MKPTTTLLLVLLTASPAAAIPAQEARHLLIRTSFAASPAEVAAMKPLTRGQAVDRVLSTARTSAHTPAPGWVDDGPVRRDRMMRKLRARSLKAWWYAEMLATPSPFTEVMTLFWHGHFTSGLRKVRSPVLMWRQNQTLRRHALGRFDALLGAMARDPAMLRYLDGARNRKGAPNENFAREVMELFTLGEGNGYTEADISEVARAFTGWGLRRADGTFRFRRRHHDDGVKTVLGQTGRWDGDDVLRILLERPETATYMVTRLWRHFVSDTPDAAVVARLAADFRAGYAIRPLMAALLRTDAFWSAREALVKSPVDLIVGTLRSLELRFGTGALAKLGRRLGQDLFDPPNVKGWPGGTAWITTVTWVDRRLALSRVTGGARTPALLDPAYQLK